MSFSPRLTSPDVTIKYYRHTGYYIDNVEGVNECLLIDSATGEIMPNCVGYTWGRWYEISNERPTLSRGDGYTWYNYPDGYQRLTAVDTPKVGDIACFSGGTEGYGHVNLIEEKVSNTEFITSNSYASGTYFILEYLRFDGVIWKRYNYNSGNVISGYSCQGFIVNPYMPPAPTINSTFKLIYCTRKIF